MRAWCLAVILTAVMVCGCGNVYLQGEALTAAQVSTFDAYNAVQRSGAMATTQPTWQQSYLIENFKQWRSFVRAAMKDLAWGPRVEGE